MVIGDPSSRLDVARRLGASVTFSVSGMTAQARYREILGLSDGRGADVVIEAAGQPAAFGEGMGLLGFNGRYLVLGLYSGRAESMIDPVRINNRNLAVIGSFGSSGDDYRQAIAVAARYGEALNFEGFVTHRFSRPGGRSHPARGDR